MAIKGPSGGESEVADYIKRELTAAGVPASAMRQANWKLIHFYEDDRLELYKLDVDPSETKNLADDQPNVARHLKRQLDDWRDEVQANVPTLKK